MCCKACAFPICKRTQCNGGCAKPNWHVKSSSLQSRKIELQTLDGCEMLPHLHCLLQLKLMQQQTPTEQNLCAAAVMMHGPPPNMRLSSAGPSAACPPIQENQEWTPPAPTAVQWPQPGYRVAANLCNLDIPYHSSVPGPMASFLRHVATMQSPENPSYSHSGPVPVQEARDLQTQATLDNLAHQLYLEKLNFDLNTLRLWSSGIQYDIMAEARTVQRWLPLLISPKTACYAATKAHPASASVMPVILIDWATFRGNLIHGFKGPSLRVGAVRQSPSASAPFK